MMRVDEIVEAIGPLRRSDLDAWIKEELIAPQDEGGSLIFSDVECARIRLICTLRYELEIDTEALPVILSLVDQLYRTRRHLRSLSAAILAQDKSVQAAILDAIDLGNKIHEKTWGTQTD